MFHFRRKNISSEDGISEIMFETSKQAQTQRLLVVAALNHIIKPESNASPAKIKKTGDDDGKSIEKSDQKKRDMIIKAGLKAFMAKKARALGSTGFDVNGSSKLSKINMTKEENDSDNEEIDQLIAAVLEESSPEKVLPVKDFPVEELAPDRSIEERMKYYRTLHFEKGEDIFGMQYASIYKAAMDGNFLGVKYFLDRNKSGKNKCVNVDEYDRTGQCAIHYAAQYNRTEVIELLVMCGCDVNIPTKDKMTPLLIAAKYGHVEALKQIISLGGCLHSRGRTNTSAAHYAAQNNHDQIISALHEAIHDYKVMLLASILQTNINDMQYYIRIKYRPIVSSPDFENQCDRLANGIDRMKNRWITETTTLNERIIDEMYTEVDILDSSTTNGLRPLHLAAENDCLKALDALLSLSSIDSRYNTLIAGNMSRDRKSSLSRSLNRRHSNVFSSQDDEKPCLPHMINKPKPNELGRRPSVELLPPGLLNRRGSSQAYVHVPMIPLDHDHGVDSHVSSNIVGYVQTSRPNTAESSILVPGQINRRNSSILIPNPPEQGHMNQVDRIKNIGYNGRPDFVPEVVNPGSIMRRTSSQAYVYTLTSNDEKWKPSLRVNSRESHRKTSTDLETALQPGIIYRSRNSYVDTKEHDHENHPNEIRRDHRPAFIQGNHLTLIQRLAAHTSRNPSTSAPSTDISAKTSHNPVDRIVNVNSKDSSHETPLHKAARNKLTISYQKLVAAGASEDILNMMKQSPKQLLLDAD